MNPRGAMVASLLALLLVTGCASVEDKPVERIVFQTKEVQIPVPVPCKVSLPPVPVWYTETLDLKTATDDQINQAIQAELEQRIAYEALVLAEAKKCE